MALLDSSLGSMAHRETVKGAIESTVVCDVYHFVDDYLTLVVID